MIYSLTSDGVNDKGTFASSVTLGTSWDVESTKEGLEDGFDIIVGGSASTRFVRVDFSAGNTKILCRINSSTVRTFDLGANYKNVKKTYKVTLRAGGVLSAFVDGVLAGTPITDTGMVSLPIDRSFDYGNILSTASAVTDTLKVTDNNNSANNIELVNNTGTGSIWADVSGNSNDLTLINFPTNNSQWTLIGGGGISGTITQTAQSFTQSLSGGVVNSYTGTITQNTQSFTQSASGSITSEPITGIINQTASAFTQSATGSAVLNISGVISQTVSAFTQSSSGTVAEQISGTINQTVSSFTMSAVGKIPASWVDKLPASTTWVDQTAISTIWTDK